jgi:hypothetical protein
MHETGFTKLFSSIITSTIWQEDDKTRLVWITMIALANKYGEVGGTAPGIARMAGVTLEDAIKAIEKLEAPDPLSRDQEHEGRRIKRIDGGYQILNYLKYRNKMRSRAEYMKEYRAKQQQNPQ